jgi:hypothetical protein
MGNNLAAWCRDCVKTQHKFWRKKINLLNRAVLNFFDTGNGLPTHDFSAMKQLRIQ